MINRTQISLVGITPDGRFLGMSQRHGMIYHFNGAIFTRTCCKASNYDWDEFMKIPGCAISYHSDVKLSRVSTANEICADSPVRVDVAQIGFQALEVPSVTPSTNDGILVPLKTPNGLFKCAHMGCGKEYDPEHNDEKSCSYHSGKAGFRDTRKYWSCCDASSYDWDEFMKIPTCSIGKHEPKLVPETTSEPV
jgi:disease resistance protein